MFQAPEKQVTHCTRIAFVVGGDVAQIDQEQPRNLQTWLREDDVPMTDIPMDDAASRELVYTTGEIQKLFLVDR